MNYYSVTYSNSLSHHGIKGQKWGVRRFQNGDGSYTAAGKSRYGVLGKLGSRVAKGSNAILQRQHDKNYSKPKVWRTDSRRATSANKQLGRKINASYEDRLARGEKLARAGRTRVGAVGRAVGRSMGRDLAINITRSIGNITLNIAFAKNPTALAIGKSALDTYLRAADAYGAVSNAVRTYQDISDINTYKKSQKKKP